MAKRECFDDGFDESLPSCQDWDMWLRIAKKGYKFDYVNEALMLYHLHPKQISQSHDRSIRGTQMIVKKFASEYKQNPKALANRLTRIGNLYLHVGEMRKGEKYLVKALMLNLFEWRTLVRLILSLPGFKFYNKLTKWKHRKRFLP